MWKLKVLFLTCQRLERSLTWDHPSAGHDCFCFFLSRSVRKDEWNNVESAYCSSPNKLIITSTEESSHWTESYLADLIDQLLIFLSLLSKWQQAEIPIVKFSWLTLHYGNISVQHQNTKVNFLKKENLTINEKTDQITAVPIYFM